MFDHLLDGRWWDIGLDLVTGCTPVSAGCDHCWSAERAHRAGYQKNPKMRARYGGLTDTAGHWTGEVRPQWQDLDKIGRARKPQVYTFWNDLFHEDISFDLSQLLPVPESFIDEVMLKILTRPQHFYIICTKRPERALEYFLSRQDDISNWPGARNILERHLMLITTAETQAMADLRLPILLQIPGVMHGVSYEPALGPVDWTKYLSPAWRCICGTEAYPLTDDTECQCKDYYDQEWSRRKALDLIVAGSETGSHARPSHPDWFRQARDQAVAAGVPFFFKGWGRFVQCTEDQEVWNREDGDFDILPAQQCFNRVDKKAAGRHLDGRTWDEVPNGL
jgi:protein gp37